MMQAVLVKPGSDGPLALSEVAIPQAGPGEVLIRVHAAALDRVDTFIRHGSHGMGGAHPVTLGRDFAGVVEAIGEGVSDVRVGDRVVACGRGAHAEFALAPALHTLPMPGGWTFLEAAALPTAGRTAYAAVNELAKIGPADRVLVTAAGGGVGSSAVQFCRIIGAEVIATVGSEWKEDRARAHGASHVYRHDQPGWGKRLLHEVGAVTVVIETVGAAAWPEALTALDDGGTLVCCGVSSGHHLDLHLGHVMTRGWRVLGIGRPDKLTVRNHLLATLLSYDDAGVRPVIDQVFPLSDSETAHAALERSEFFGRIVLETLRNGAP